MIKSIKGSAQKPERFGRIEPINEPFVGAWMATAAKYKKMTTAQLFERQQLVQVLYEGRFASMQRLVAFFVMFHAMGKRVQDFWPMVSCGLLGYDMSRSQSMLRVATTASPISGSEVRERILELGEEEMRKWAARTIQRAARFVQMIQKHHRSKAQDTIFSQAIANSGASNATTTTGFRFLVDGSGQFQLCGSKGEAQNAGCKKINRALGGSLLKPNATVPFLLIARNSWAGQGLTEPYVGGVLSLAQTLRGHLTGAFAAVGGSGAVNITAVHRLSLPEA